MAPNIASSGTSSGSHQTTSNKLNSVNAVNTEEEGEKQPLVASPPRQVAGVQSTAKLLLTSPAVLRLLSCTLDGVEWVLDLLTRETKENLFLLGNFAPVEEAPQVLKDLKIDGTLPEYLRGEFVRVGANPKYKPRAGYHWFDGDGMLHGVRFNVGSASYVNRYVKTSRLHQEDAAGRPLFVKIGEMKGVVGLARLLMQQFKGWVGLLDMSQGAGTANTAVVYHSGNLLALQEADLPYAVRVFQDGDMETIGRMDYGGALEGHMTAHPKIDPLTGELYTFSYGLQTTPYVHYWVIDADGSMTPKIPISIPEPVMMHDFAITEKHAIFMDLPLVFDPQVMVAKGRIPFTWKEGRAARFGILPRNDKTEANIKWFERPPLFIFHTANAWEDGPEVFLTACRFDSLDLGGITDPQDSPGLLTQFRFNMESGASSEVKLSDIRCDFPKINEGLMGRKQRFVYSAAVDGIADLVGVVKFDLSKDPKYLDKNLLETKYSTTAAVAAAECVNGGCAVGFFDFGPGRFGSEPMFVPRGGASPLLSEDDGCVLNMVYDSNTNLSEVLVIDAKTMSSTPLAIIHPGCRVPYGFHGTFISEEQLEKQK